MEVNMDKFSTPPCYKYIAKNLSSPNDRYVFSRHFFEKLSTSHVDITESIMLYSSLSMPASVGKPYSYNEEELSPAEYYKIIMDLSDIPAVSCPQFYKAQLNPNNQNNLCHICNLSKSCKTANYETECAIMKYIISSRENLVRFDNLGVKNVFKSVYDIASEIDFNMPAVVPLLKTAYSVICSIPDEVYATNDIRTRLEGLVGKITVEATKNPNVRDVQMSNHKSLPVAWELVISDILSAKDLNYDEVCAEVSKVDLVGSKKKKANKKKNDIVQENPLFDLLLSPSHNDENSIEKDNHFDHSQTIDTSESNPITPEEAGTLNATSIIAKEDSETHISKYSVPAIDEGDLIYNLTVNKNTFKHYSYSYKSKEDEIFKIIQKSRRLPLEVIYDEKGFAYLFMFVRAIGKFFYCPIDKNIPNSLIAILLSKSVIKICYQPYFLYSLLRLYDIRICGVYSICTMDKLLHPEAQIAYYRDYFNVYAGDFVNLKPVDTGFDEFDTLIQNLQKYILIQAKQTRCTFDASKYNKMHSRDEVLGSSFLRILNLKLNDYLFSLAADGSFIYNREFELIARHDGFFVTYSVGAEDLDIKELPDIYLDALYELSSKGRFKKYNIQLVTITDTAMTLFIGESEYELITTVLQKHFNRYALINHIEKFELNVAHQRVYCNSKRNPLQRQLPRTYEQAMDLLITTNDSISVDETHVVKREQVKRKRQTQLFKPV